jgi:hypothetical protein
MEKQVITSQGIIAELGEALRQPLEYELTLGPLGWGLRHIESDFTTMINENKAFLFVVAWNKAHKEYMKG